MRKIEVINAELERARRKVAELETELKAAEEVGKEVTERVKQLGEKFDAERRKEGVNPFTAV